MAAPDPALSAEPVAATLFARKYGVAAPGLDPLDIFRRQGRSGFTPTSPLNTILPRTAEQMREIQWIDRYQADLFAGFSMRMLEDMGALALADPDVSYTTLTNPMHPIFIKKWESSVTTNRYKNRPNLPIDLKGDCYSLPDDNTGFWAMDNPVVRDILEPCLRLATRFIENIHTNEWLDAFLSSTFRPLDLKLDPRSPTKKAFSSLYTFHRPPFRLLPFSEITARAESWLMDTLEPKILFAIADARYDPLDGVTPVEDFYYACTGGMLSEEEGEDGKIANVLITLSTQLLTPLLRNDLNVGERLTEQAFVALVILHELGHALNLSLVNSPTHPHLSAAHEPFFESEPVAELGHSFVSSFLGGAFHPFFHRDDLAHIPRMGLAMVDWPNVKYDQGMKLLGAPGLRQRPQWYPILNKWYEVIQTDEFWDTGVEKLGLGLAKAWTGTGSRVVVEEVGKIRVYEKLEPTEREIESGFPEVEEWAQVLAVMEMKPAEREAFVYMQNLERMKRHAIERSLWRAKREVAVMELKNAVANLKAAQNLRMEIAPVLAALLEKLKAEAQEQLNELITLIDQKGLGEPNLVRHKDLLVRVNRHLRKLTSNFKDDCKTYALERLEIESRPLEALLLACQAVLSDIDNSIADPKQYLQDEVAKAVTEMDTALQQFEAGEKMAEVLSAIKIIHTPIDATASRSEIASLLMRARKAHLVGDTELCNEYAMDILLNIDESRVTDTTSALAGVVARAFLCRKLPVDDRLGETQRLVVMLEDIRTKLREEGEGGDEGVWGHWGYWYDVARGLVAEQLRRSRVGRVSVRDHVERVWGDDLELM